jgi:acyl carrier protein
VVENGAEGRGEVPEAQVQAALVEIRRILAEDLEWTGRVEPTHELLGDLQLDSLGLTVLAVGREIRFRIRLTEEDSVGVRTVGELARRVAARVAGARAAAGAPPAAEAAP